MITATRWIGSRLLRVTVYHGGGRVEWREAWLPGGKHPLQGLEAAGWCV